MIDWFLGILREALAIDDGKRLLDDLFSVYDNVARPVIEEDQKIVLSIGLKLSQIADIVSHCVSIPICTSLFNHFMFCLGWKKSNHDDECLVKTWMDWF